MRTGIAALFVWMSGCAWITRADYENDISERELGLSVVGVSPDAGAECAFPLQVELEVQLDGSLDGTSGRLGVREASGEEVIWAPTETGLVANAAGEVFTRFDHELSCWDCAPEVVARWVFDGVEVVESTGFQVGVEQPDLRLEEVAVVRLDGTEQPVEAADDLATGPDGTALFNTDGANRLVARLQGYVPSASPEGRAVLCPDGVDPAAGGCLTLPAVEGPGAGSLELVVDLAEVQTCGSETSQVWIEAVGRCDSAWFPALSVAHRFVGEDCDGDGETSHLFGGLDCDDDDAAVFRPPSFRDADGDGFGDPGVPWTDDIACPGSGWVRIGEDCDDDDATVNPDQVDLVCDDDDVDCDPSTPTVYVDADFDGFAGTATACDVAPAGAASSSDCNDADPGVHEGAIEICGDGVDSDCDVDEDDDVGPPLTVYRDADADGAGDPSNPGVQACVGNGWVDNADDCDDNEPDWLSRAWYRDDDLDGRGDPATRLCSEHPQVGYVQDASDCDDTDPALPSLQWLDVDLDGLGDPAFQRLSCDPIPTGWADNAMDCAIDDAALANWPGTVTFLDTGGSLPPVEDVLLTPAAFSLENLSGRDMATICAPVGGARLGEAITLDQAITITSGNGGLQRLDGDLQHRLFDLQGDITLENLALTNGNSPDSGGCVRSTMGLLTVRDSRLEGCETHAQGGALIADGLVLERTTVAHTVSGNRGAVRASSSLTITDSLFEHNRAGVFSAVFAPVNTDTVITGTTFRDNLAEDGAGGALGCPSCRLTVMDSTFDRNAVDPASQANGGAIHTRCDSYTHLIQGTRFYGNSAYRGGALAGVSTGDFTGPCEVRVTDSLFVGNQATSRGGHIYLFGADLTLTDTDLVEGNAGAPDTVSEGGAVFAFFVSTPPVPPNPPHRVVEVVGGAFLRNTTDGDGGALMLQTGNTLEVTDAIFDGNDALNGGHVSLADADATFSGAQLLNTDVEGDGGAVHATGSGTLSFDETCALNGHRANRGGAIFVEGVDLESICDSCTGPTPGGGLELHDNAAHTEGGAIWMSGETASLSLTGADLQGNLAPLGAGLFLGDSSLDDRIIDLTSIDASAALASGGSPQGAALTAGFSTLSVNPGTTLDLTRSELQVGNGGPGSLIYLNGGSGLDSAVLLEDLQVGAIPPGQPAVLGSPNSEIDSLPTLPAFCEWGPTLTCTTPPF